MKRATFLLVLVVVQLLAIGYTAANADAHKGGPPGGMPTPPSGIPTPPGGWPTPPSGMPTPPGGMSPPGMDKQGGSEGGEEGGSRK